MNDERFYADVVEELRLHGPVPGLWAKAYAEANGNKPQAEALYLRYRVEQLVQAERTVGSKPKQGNDDLESLYAEFSGNLAKHAPFLLGILAFIIFVAVSYFKQ
jgi:hypothetical protein